MKIVQLDTFRRDTRHALRTMRRQPVFAAAAILTLAVAIGGNTAIFSVVRAVLLKPLGYRDPDRLVRITGGATPTRFAEMRATAKSFSATGAYTFQQNLTLAGGSEPEVLKAVRISASFLDILAVEPLRGRGFRPEEDGPGGAPVAMISSALWRRRFAGDPRAIGKTITLSDTPYVIIGVLPPHFQFPFPGIDLWLTAPAEEPGLPPASRALSPFLTLFGRLKPGVNLVQAGAELKVIRHRYALAHPAMLDAKPKIPEVTLLKDSLVADIRTILWILFGAVIFVLLIACANVGGLLMARAAFRAREMAIRAALGAARNRLIRQLLAESVLLSAAGGTLGVLLAAWSLRAIPAIRAFNLPRAGEVHLDAAVLAFAALLSLGTGVIFGLAPALAASRPDLMGVLRTGSDTGSRSSAGSSLNARTFLLMGQVALSIVLLIGAALLIESVSRLRGVQVGFNTSHLLTMQVSLPPVRYDTPRKTSTFFETLQQNLEGLPGIRRATAAMTLPMMGYAGVPVQDASKPLRKLNERLIATFLVVTPGYFRTLEIPLRRGRDFNERDRDGATRVAIIDESLARRFWPEYPAGIDPVGQHLWVGGTNPKPAEIVGIAADVHQSLEGGAWPQSVYVCFAQNSQPAAMLAVRTAGEPLAVTAAVRSEMRKLDTDQAITRVRAMDDLVEDEVGQRRLLEILLGTFAGVAVTLALMGIYGVIAYSVAQRTREMGIRRALGAQPHDILRLVVLQGFRLALAGVAVGLAAAYGLTRLMQSVLFHVSATDPATFLSVAILFLVVALAAGYLPARRATRIDPMAALRLD